MTRASGRSGRGAISLNTEPQPRQEEIWLVRFDPTVGTEIRKTRPAVILNRDSVGALPLRLVAPLTDWSGKRRRYAWHVRIDPDSSNGLTKASAVDALQLRGMDLTRFQQRMGSLSADDLQRIVAVVTLIIRPGP